MIGLAGGIALMGAIVTARWPGGLASAATDPRPFVNGLSVAFLVNAVVALVAAALAAITIAGRRSASVRSEGRQRRRSGDDHQAVARSPAQAS